MSFSVEAAYSELRLVCGDKFCREPVTRLRNNCSVEDIVRVRDEHLIYVHNLGKRLYSQVYLDRSTTVAYPEYLAEVRKHVRETLRIQFEKEGLRRVGELTEETVPDDYLGALTLRVEQYGLPEDAR